MEAILSLRKQGASPSKNWISSDSVFLKVQSNPFNPLILQFVEWKTRKRHHCWLSLPTFENKQIILDSY